MISIIKANNILKKGDMTEVYSEKQEGLLFLFSDKTNQLVSLNETSVFLFENCEGKMVLELCEQLFNACVDKELLDKKAVFSECLGALQHLLDNQLIEIVEDKRGE